MPDSDIVQLKRLTTPEVIYCATGLVVALLREAKHPWAPALHVVRPGNSIQSRFGQISCYPTAHLEVKPYGAAYFVAGKLYEHVEIAATAWGSHACRCGESHVTSVRRASVRARFVHYFTRLADAL